jgi:hypothetical protein
VQFFIKNRLTKDAAVWYNGISGPDQLKGGRPGPAKITGVILLGIKNADKGIRIF